MKNLAEPAYQIDEQAWLRLPIDSGYAIWTEPYFDSGGGEVWMRTRAVPVIVGSEIVAVATTDIEVEEP
jgi:sigma-B regulation protein RsbU (phosphoserine phosphatase)